MYYYSNVNFVTHLLTTLLTNVYNIDLQDHNNLSVNSLILTFNSNKFSYKCLLSLSHYIIFIDAKTCYLVIPELIYNSLILLVILLLSNWLIQPRLTTSRAPHRPSVCQKNSCFMLINLLLTSHGHWPINYSSWLFNQIDTICQLQFHSTILVYPSTILPPSVDFNSSRLSTLLLINM